MEYIIEEKDKNKRLDVFLTETLEDITRSYIKKLQEDDNILVNGKKEKSGYSLKVNDNISVFIPEDKLSEIIPEDIDLKIIYEDDDYIIIDKEKGMVVHPGNGNYTGTLVNALAYSHKDKLSSINGIIRPGIVHRIDKNTSGVLVVAKNDKAHKILSEQFKAHSIKRVYIALAKGIIKKDEFTVDMPIGRNTKERKKMAITYTNSKNAITHINVLKRFYNSMLTLVEVTLETGRTHQIRVHMAYSGHALLGDDTYGKKDTKFKIEGQMLHAKVLGFMHPTTNKYVEYESKLPNEFSDLLEKLEKKEEI